MTNWKYEVKTRAQKSREPMQDSFFSNASIEDDSQALIREGCQNSLDANIGHAPPARVVITLGTAKNAVTNYFTEELWKHVSAEDNGLKDRPNEGEACRFLTFEDFNTSGLEGDYEASVPSKDNNFYSFMRAEGHSGHQEGKRGRHGIGKFVFPKFSRIRTILILTIRSSDGKELIAGQSILRSHNVDGEQFTPDGWWGHFESDGFQLPVDDGSESDLLRDTFSLTRGTGDTGLSVVVPFIPDNVNTDRICEQVISEYFYPILNDQLVVTIRDLSSGVELVLEAESLYADYKSLLTAESIEKIGPYIEVANKVVGQEFNADITLKTPESIKAPIWSKDLFEIEELDSIKTQLKIDESICRIRVPIYVQRKSDENAQLSHFNMYICSELSQSSFRPWFIREGIKITEDKVAKINGYICIAHIEKGLLGDMLGDSENPAHTEWEKNAVKFRDEWEWGPSTITYVRLCFRKFLDNLDSADSELDRDILADIFSIDLPEPEDDNAPPRKKKKKPGEKVTPDTPPPPPPSKPKYFHITRTSAGFKISGPDEPMEATRKYKATVAYAQANRSRRSSINKYDERDFDFGKEEGIDSLSTGNLSVIQIDRNQIIFSTDSNEFKIEVSGFDPNRDLIVDVKSEAMP